MALTAILNPVKTVNGVLSDVVAAESQIPFEVLRKDFVLAATADEGGFFRFDLTGDQSTQIVVGDSVFIGDDNNTYPFAGTVTAVTVPSVTRVVTNIPYVAGTVNGWVNILSGTRIDYRVLMTVNDAAGTALIIPTIFRYQTQPNGRLFVDIGEIIKPLLSAVDSLIARVRMQEFWNGASQGTNLLFDAFQSILGREQQGHNGGSNMWNILPMRGSVTASASFASVSQPAPDRIRLVTISADFAVGDTVSVNTTDGLYRNVIGEVLEIAAGTSAVIGIPWRGGTVANTPGGTAVAHYGSILSKFKNPLIWLNWKRTASYVRDSNYVTRVAGGAARVTWRAFNINGVAIGAEIGVNDATTPAIYPATCPNDLKIQAGAAYMRARVLNNNPVVILTNDLFAYRISPDCKRPVYVEWRNSLGALDQHLFAVSQAVEENTENDVSFESPITQDLSTALNTAGNLIGNTRQRITVTADKLLIDQMRALAEIKTSNEVYVYLTKDGSSKVQVRAFGAQAYNTKPRGSAFELVIQLEFPEGFNLFDSNQYGL